MTEIIARALLWAETRVHDDRGAGLAEYALILVLVGIASIGLLTGLSGAINGVFTTVTNAITGAN